MIISFVQDAPQDERYAIDAFDKMVGKPFKFHGFTAWPDKEQERIGIGTLASYLVVNDGKAVELTIEVEEVMDVLS